MARAPFLSAYLASEILLLAAWNEHMILAKKQLEIHLRDECPDNLEEALEACEFCAHDLRDIEDIECPEGCMGCIMDLHDDNTFFLMELG